MTGFQEYRLCDALIYSAAFLAPIGILATITGIEAMHCIYYQFSVLCQKKKESNLRPLYLHMFDSLWSGILFTLLSNDIVFGRQFALSRNEWVRSAFCKFICFLAQSAIHCSVITKFMMAFEMAVIVHKPFDAGESLHKLRIVLNMYWLLPLLLASLHVHFVETPDQFCIHLIPEHHTIVTKFLLSSSFALSSLAFVIYIIISTKTLHMMKMTRLSSGRAETEQDRHLQVRTIVSVIINISMWITLVFYLSWGLVNKNTPSEQIKISQLFTLSMPAVADPILLTLSTRPFYLHIKRCQINSIG